MNIIRMRFILLVLIIAAASATAACAQSSGRQRGFMFEVGAGPAYISYGSSVDAALAAAEASGFNRAMVYVNIDLGYAFSDNLYLVAGFDGVGDRFYQGSYYMQFNSYLYHLGLRLYPFETGLVLGIDGGASALLIQSNVGYGGSTPYGWGAAATVAYDFARRPTGFGIEIGAKLDYLSIESSPFTAASLYLDLLWK